MVPQAVREQYKERTGIPREPRGSRAGWYAYDPYELNLVDKERVDRINLLRDEIANERKLRQRFERAIKRIRQQ